MKKTRKGFTLVEILIVVVILGILAAIVIPQFSQASTDSKKSSLMSNLQSLRSAVALYKIQHDDVIPADGAALMTALTTKTLKDGSAADVGDVGFGPYIQQAVPVNPFTTGNVIGDAVEGSDWVYDPADDGSWTFGVGQGSVAGSTIAEGDLWDEISVY